MATAKTPLVYTRPQDESFEAYKKWIIGLGKRMGAKGPTPPDAELRKDWQEFWSKAKGKKKK